MNLGKWQIDDLLTFTVQLQSFSTGAATDGDSPPTYRVYEDETGTPILTGTMALLDDSNTVGLYSEQITLSAANGLEVGKSYTIRIAATVGGVSGATLRNFQVETAKATASALATLQSTADDLPTNAELATALGTSDDAVLTQVALVKAKTDLIPAAPAAVGDIPTAAQIADAVHDEAIDGAYTFRQSMRLSNAVLVGKVSGAGTGVETFRDISDTKNRVRSTVDSNGNRTAVTVDGT